MKTSDFSYHLPDVLIAQKPDPVRSASRLLSYNRQSDSISHGHFSDIRTQLNPGDLLVFNDTRVIPARMYGAKDTGGKAEILIERVKDDKTAIAHVKSSKTAKPGTLIHLDSHGQSRKGLSGQLPSTIEVTGREGDFFIIKAVSGSLAEIISDCGHMPLPPYIQRDDDEFDAERYQTVYAAKPGAVAAPTAGLHFDDELLAELAQMGVNSSFVTLHVGAGTFQPVRSENIEDHHMHSEYIEVPEDTVEACRRANAEGHRVVSVGTTSMRSLEAASQSGSLQPFKGDSDIFIYPGYRFRSVDALITNFHLPESTLLMLISAFAGKDEIMRCYQEAIAQRYRFFSYGDAMFIS